MLNEADAPSPSRPLPDEVVHRTEDPSRTLPDTDSLTPTQELVMEVLAARYRLGENTWTFGKRHGHALASLAYDGYVSYKSGVVQDTLLAWMTPEGRAAALDPDYTRPDRPMPWKATPCPVCGHSRIVGHNGAVCLNQACAEGFVPLRQRVEAGEQRG